MPRRLFTVLSALSLLLCVAAVVLWVRSHRVRDDRLASEMARLKGRIQSHRAFPTAREAYSVPHYLLALSAAVLPAAWLTTSLTGWARRRARRLGSHCLRCGYDLRATPGRCPECGEPPAGAEA